MRMNEVEVNSIISAGRFLNEYVLPLYGGNITTMLDDNALTNMSHLDLDELGISCIKRCSDEYALKDPNIILVGAKGKSHRGYEVHGYYRPFNLRKQELLEEGYSEEEVIAELITAIPTYSATDFSYLDRKEKQKTRNKGKRRR